MRRAGCWGRGMGGRRRVGVEVMVRGRSSILLFRGNLITLKSLIVF